MMLSCLAIEPSWAAVRRGLSYYGNSGTTIVPYVLGFGLSIVMTALGLAQINPNDAAGKRFRRFVATVLALMLVIPFTPYRVDLIFDWLHIGAAAALFASGLVLGGWLALRLRDRLTRTLYLLESASALAIVAAQIGLNGYMIPTELWFQLTVFGLVLHGIRRLTPRPSSGAPTPVRANRDKG